jgi:Tfp pilus assembly protein PilV
MKKVPSLFRSHRRTSSRRGFLLVEVILASSILGLLVTTFVGAYLFGEESTLLAGNRARATYLAEEGLEAARAIRDAGYANLVDGTYGLSATGVWALAGASDTSEIFTREISITSSGANRKNITATITWQQNPQREGRVVLTTLLTNWRAVAEAPPEAPPAEEPPPEEPPVEG